MGKEKDVETEIIQYINYKGGYAIKVHSGGMMKSYRNKFGQTKTHKINLAPTGTPDIIACIDGAFFGIEVKKDQKEVAKWWKQKDDRSINQHYQLERIDKAGGQALITYSLDDFISLLEPSPELPL